MDKKKNEYNRILELVGEKEVRETTNTTHGNEMVEVYLKKEGANASGIYNFKTKTLEVLKGSKYKLNRAPSIPHNYIKMFNQLISDEVIRDEYFVKNNIFTSSSAAASIVLNRNARGNDWSDESGKDLNTLIKEYYESKGVVRTDETVEIDLEDLFLPNEQINDILNILERKKNVILQGVPGVGKTFVIKSILKSRWEISDENLITVQFHQSYSYEEFIEGLRPNENNSFEIKQGKFKEFVGKAIENPGENYFFIIDEINRGNLSKIFGELLMLIEDDKRGKETVYLPYSGEEFTVPENLYIVGTMNITDRSLSLVDYALRRRFSFFTLKPAFNTNKFNNFMLYKLNYTQEQLNKINNIMSQINKEITNRMGESFNIGHSYFIVKPKDRNNDFDKFLNEIFKYEILPLIEEYFFDDLEAIEKFKEIMELNGERS